MNTDRPITPSTPYNKPQLLFSAKNSAMNSLFTLIARDTTLTRTSAKHGGEYSGPCPLCRKGSDRFKVWPALGRWGVGPAWLERLTLAPRVLVAFDVDANGAGDFRRAQVELEAWMCGPGGSGRARGVEWLTQVRVKKWLARQSDGIAHGQRGTGKRSFCQLKSRPPLVVAP